MVDKMVMNAGVVVVEYDAEPVAVEVFDFDAWVEAGVVVVDSADWHHLAVNANRFLVKPAWL